MSSPWTALLPVATVGTDRHAAPLPTWPGDIGEAIQQAAGAAPDPATALLRTVAVLAGCGLAGAQGSAAPSYRRPPPTKPCPPPAPAWCSTRCARRSSTARPGCSTRPA